MKTQQELQKTADSITRGVTVSLDATHVSLTLGGTTCQFPHDVDADAFDAQFRAQLGNVIREAIKKPRTVHEHGAWLAKEAERTRAALQAEAVAQEAKRLAGLSDHHRTAEEYRAEYGENDYFTALGTSGKWVDRLTQLDALEALGMDEAEVTEERERLTAWRDRCEQRRKADKPEGAPR